MKRCIVIMSGGAGKRLWPVSRKRRPKQFLDLLGQGRSMIQATVDRVAPLHAEVVVVAAEEQGSLVLSDLPTAKLVIEPFGRNTAPALGLAALHLSRNDQDCVMVCLPCDHVFENASSLLAALQQAVRLAEKSSFLVTLGIEPTWAHPKLGYIERGDILGEENCYQVKRFHEKPGAEKAADYLQQGGFYWNAGIFVWRVKAFLSALHECQPELYAQLQSIGAALGTTEEQRVAAEIYQAMRPISVDFAVMEPWSLKGRVATISLCNAGWCDIGSWDVWSEFFPWVGQGNRFHGNVIESQVGGGNENCIAYCDQGTLVLAGMHNVIVVRSGDVILVCPKALASGVGDIVDEVSRHDPSHE